MDYPVQIHQKARTHSDEARREALAYIEKNMGHFLDKRDAWDDLHALARNGSDSVRIAAARALGNAYVFLPDRDMAWADLHALIGDDDYHVRREAAVALGNAFSLVPDKNMAWGDLHRLTCDDGLFNDDHFRRIAAIALGNALPSIPDKGRAWEDLHGLSRDRDSYVRRHAVEALGRNFPVLPDKKAAQEDLHRLGGDANDYVRKGAARAIGSAFPSMPDGKQASEDLYSLAGDSQYVSGEAAAALGNAFPFMPDKGRAWRELIRLTTSYHSSVRLEAVDAIGDAFSMVPDRGAAWKDLHALVGDEDDYVRRGIAIVLGNVFSSMPDKGAALEDLLRLAEDPDGPVKCNALHSLGKARVYYATVAESESAMRHELENAIGYFEKASQVMDDYNPARFCMPFYLSFYTLAFKDDADAILEVGKYLAEAKKAIGQSRNRELLLVVVENLSHALELANRLKDMDVDHMREGLSACLGYCNNATRLLEETERENPMAARLVRRGLPIIDAGIRKQIDRVRKDARAACRESRGTEWEATGKSVVSLADQVSRNAYDGIVAENITMVLDSISAVLGDLPGPEQEHIGRLLREAAETEDIIKKSAILNTVIQRYTAHITYHETEIRWPGVNSTIWLAMKIMGVIADIITIYVFLNIR